MRYLESTALELSSDAIVFENATERSYRGVPLYWETSKHVSVSPITSIPIPYLKMWLDWLAPTFFESDLRKGKEKGKTVGLQGGSETISQKGGGATRGQVLSNFREGSGWWFHHLLMNFLWVQLGRQCWIAYMKHELVPLISSLCYVYENIHYM